MAGGAAGSMGENLNMHTVDETLIFMWLECEGRTSRTSRGPGGGATGAAWGAQGSWAPSQVNSGALRGSRCPEDLSIATMGPQMSWVGRTRLPFLCIAVCVLNRFKREIHTLLFHIFQGNPGTCSRGQMKLVVKLNTDFMLGVFSQLSRK